MHLKTLKNKETWRKEVGWCEIQVILNDEDAMLCNNLKEKVYFYLRDNIRLGYCYLSSVSSDEIFR